MRRKSSWPRTCLTRRRTCRCSRLGRFSCWPGMFTLPVFLLHRLLIPQASVRFVVWLASHTAYRIRVFGREHLAERGGGAAGGQPRLLAGRYSVALDQFAAGAHSGVCQQSPQPAACAGWRDWRASFWSRRNRRSAGGVRAARQALRDGEIVGVFPEGGMTRSGVMQAFRPRRVAQCWKASRSR